jgi:hypothetical protein
LLRQGDFNGRIQKEVREVFVISGLEKRGSRVGGGVIFGGVRRPILFPLGAVMDALA